MSDEFDETHADFMWNTNDGCRDGFIWESKKRFINTRQTYHESWIKHQKCTFEEQKEITNPVYMRMNGDVKRLIQNELSDGNHTTREIEEANEPQRFPSILKKYGQPRGNKDSANVF